MYRVGVIVAVSLLSACAVEPERIVVMRTKVVEKPVVYEQTCTVTRQSESICGRPRACTDPGMTCAEAYHRLTVCNEYERDGGVAGGVKGPDGIPCENVCGKTALSMAAAVRAKPFTPPLRQDKSCTQALRRP